MAGKKPNRKPFGRESPPKGYPKDQSVYADPENWRYPLHTPWHAKAARRYFDDWSNRRKYAEDERAYIDSRINEALKEFDAKATTKANVRNRKARASKSKETAGHPLEEFLQPFLDAGRIRRATEINDSLVTILEITPTEIRARVKEYSVQIAVNNKTIVHDCQDWRNNITSKKMCKHLAKLFMMLDTSKARELLGDITNNRDQWTFTAPEEA